MEGKKFAQIGLIVVALVVAGYFGWKNSRAFSSDNPEITTRKIWYLCGNATCRNEYQVSVGESRAYVAEHGVDMPCPKCGKTISEPAYQCPSCKRVFPPSGHGSLPKNCPYCNVVLPRDLE